jgi:hypothetical protein
MKCCTSSCVRPEVNEVCTLGVWIDVLTFPPRTNERTLYMERKDVQMDSTQKTFIQVPPGFNTATYTAAYARCVVPPGYDPHSFRDAFARGAQPPHGDDHYAYRAARAVARRS